MTELPCILVADHRGQGLTARADALALAGQRVETTTTVRATLERLAELAPSLVLLDPWLPGGAEELGVFAARGLGALPVLVVVDPDGAEAALATVRAFPAATLDLVRRDAAPAEVQARVERLLALGRERARVRELEHRAAHDDRTDLLRPEAFEQRLAEHVSAAQRHKFELALLLLDLDAFGQVNKRFDHTVGDLVIAKVGDAIKKSLRQEDVAGRLGGDEFAVLLPYTARIEAAHAVRRLRDAVARLGPALATRVPGLDVSTSIGFETFDGDDLEGETMLRAHAELALREAKRMGGGQAVYYRSLSARAAPDAPPGA